MDCPYKKMTKAMITQNINYGFRIYNNIYDVSKNPYTQKQLLGMTKKKLIDIYECQKSKDMRTKLNNTLKIIY